MHLGSFVLARMGGQPVKIAVAENRELKTYTKYCWTKCNAMMGIVHI